MLGAFAVGKTSLVQRYVKSIFSEKYQTTIGVKIDKKTVVVSQTEVDLLLWDIHGEDDFQKVKSSYIVGSSGYFIVIDGTRAETFAVGLELLKLAQSAAPAASCVFLFNKADIKSEWEITENQINEIRTMGFEVIETSAKDNLSVNEAFNHIAALMLK
jgi:hypothetical protein